MLYKLYSFILILAALFFFKVILLQNINIFFYMHANIKSEKYVKRNVTFHDGS